MTAPFPESSEFPTDDAAVREMNLLVGVIAGIRNIRGEMNIPPSKNVHVVMDVANPEDAQVLQRNLAYIETLAKADDVSMGPGLAKPEQSATAVFEAISVHVILKGVIEFKEEEQRVAKAMGKVQKELDAAQKKLSNKGFMEKAPDDVVAEVTEKAEGLSAKLEKLKQNLTVLESLHG